jgi:hypothetical protein
VQTVLTKGEQSKGIREESFTYSKPAASSIQYYTNQCLPSTDHSMSTKNKRLMIGRICLSHVYFLKDSTEFNLYFSWGGGKKSGIQTVSCWVSFISVSKSLAYMKAILKSGICIVQKF